MDPSIYAGTPAAMVSVGPDRIAIVPEAASVPVRFVAADDALLLQLCGQWTTAAEAHRRWVDTFGADADDGGLAVARRLDALRERGFLARLPDWRAPARQTSAVTLVGIPTLGTRPSLKGTIGCVGDAARRAARDVTVLVASRYEAPPLPAPVPGVRAIVTVGPAERRRLASRLAGRTGVDPDVVAWLVGSPDTPATGPGANRNVLLLLAAGRPCLQIDDDVRVDRLWRRAGDSVHDGVALCMHESPAEVSVFPSRDAAFAAMQDAGTTMFDVCDRWAGLSAGRQEVGRTVTGGLAAVFFGLVGDCGTDTSAMRLGQTATRQGLWGSDADYMAGRQSREVVKAARMPAMGPALWTQTTAFLHPGGTDVPPFVPIERNEDGHWSTLLTSWAPHGLTAYLPECVAHCPEPRAGFADDDRTPFSLTRASVVGLAVSLAATLPTVRGGTDWYRAMGRALAHLDDAAEDDVVSALEAAWRRQVCGHLASLLRLAAVWPAAASRIGAADIGRDVEAAERVLMEPDAPDAVTRRATIRSAIPDVKAFGRALEAWPALCAAAAADPDSLCEARWSEQARGA